MRSQTRRYHVKLEVRNVDGTWIDVTNRLMGASIAANRDSPTATGTFNLIKVVGGQSGSPLMVGSTLNRDDLDEYAPLFNSGNRLRFHVAVLGATAAPVSGDWKHLFEGRIDKPDWAPRTTMSVTCRDLGAYLLDNIIDEARIYSDATGQFVEVVMQQLIDDNDGNATLVIPDPPDPAWVITQYEQLADVSVFQAIINLSDQIAWDTRYDYQPANNFPELLMRDVDRAKTVPDDNFTPSEYKDIPLMEMDDEGVRNFLKGWYKDAVTGLLTFKTIKHPGSILAYGRKFMQIANEFTKGITDGDRMLAMLTDMLSDLAVPWADKQVVTKLWWPAQLGDLYAFPANDNHYDEEQKFGVVAYQHDFALVDGVFTADTTLTLRGQPSGGYRKWLEKAGPPVNVTNEPPAPQIDFVLGESDSYGSDINDPDRLYDGGIWIGGRLNGGCVSATFYAELADGEGFSVDQTSSTVAIPDFRRPDGTEGDDPNWSFLIRMTSRGQFFKRITVVGRSADGALSKENIWPVAVQAIDPLPTPIDGTIADIVVVQGALPSEYYITVTPLAVDPTLTDNWIVVTRNGQTVFRKMIGTDLSPVTFLDAGLDWRNKYQWEAFIWNNGVSGPKGRWVEPLPPVLGDTPIWTVAPVAKIIGGVPQVYMEGTTGLVGADRMALVYSFDQRNTVTTNISSGLSPYIAVDPNVAQKWYKLIAYSSTDPDIYAESAWRWWPGIPSTGSSGPNPPSFVDGTPKDVQSGGPTGAMLVVVLFRWLCTTSGAAQISIQSSEDNGLSEPWVEVHRAAVLSGEWSSFDLRGQNTFYRVAALDLDGNAISWSAGVEYP